VIRYWPGEDRWIIDLEAGFHGGDIANAYADAKGAETPGNSELLWHVWETSRGRHVADEDVIAEARWLPTPDWSKVPGANKRPGQTEASAAQPTDAAEARHGGG